jgi:hypothetical protein
VRDADANAGSAIFGETVCQEPGGDGAVLQILADPLSHAFAMMAAMPTTVYGYGVTLAGNGEPVELERTPVSAAFFSLLGAHAVLGRTFLESDDHPALKQQLFCIIPSGRTSSTQTPQ